MESKLFRNATVFFNAAHALQPINLVNDLSTLAEYASVDPEGSQWRQMGFTPIVEPDEYAIDVQGAGILCCLQMNERILPGAVQREKMVERVQSIQEREGRKIGKKEYAALRDEVAMELLPQAFIRRKLIPVMFVDQWVIVFTSSASLSDAVVTQLVRAIADPNVISLHTLAQAVTANADSILTQLAKDGCSPEHDEDGNYLDNLMAGVQVVLKGENKQMIRVKDKDVQSHDVQELLKQNYTVRSLGLDFYEAGDSDPGASFVLNDMLAMSGVKLHGVETGREKDEKDKYDAFINTAWLTARIMTRIIGTVVATMQGLKDIEVFRSEHSKQAKAPVVDDDEL